MKLIDLLVEEKDVKQPVGGLILEPISESAHILGAAPLPLERINPSGQYTEVIIKIEIQKVQSGEDSYFCVVFSTNNGREIIHKYRTGEEINFSEVFGGIGCGVQRNRGTSYENYFEFSRKNFCAWEDEMPFDTIKNLDDLYATKISDELNKKVKARLADYEVRYQFLPNNSIATLMDGLTYSPIVAAVEGTYVFKNGKIVNAGNPICHSILIIGYVQNDCWYVMDSETKQVLKFDWNYKFNSPSVHSIKKTTVDITKYEGKFIKGDKPEIFLMKDGQKHSCVNKETGYTFGLRYAEDSEDGKPNFIKLSQDTIDSIPEGSPLDMADSEMWGFVKKNWAAMKVMCEPASKARVEAKLAEEKQVEEYYNQGILNLITNLFNSMGKLFGGLVKKYPKLGSSVDPEKLSLTLTSFIPLVISVGALLGFQLNSFDLQTIVTAVVAIVSGVGTLYGFARKMLVWYQNR